MDLEIIKKAGLSDAQAKTYFALLSKGVLTPAQIAEETGETRTNTYALLNKMEEKGVVRKSDGKKLCYEAMHPSVLETLAEKRRRAASKNEEALKAGMSGLLDIFYANSEKPSVKTFIGYDGIKEVYRDILNTGEKVYLIRTEQDEPLSEFIAKYRKAMAKKGIETIALTPETTAAKRHIAEGVDKELLFNRVLMPRSDYTAPVSMMVYGRKVALVAYGETEMSTVITSPAIAEAMRQMIMLLREKYAK
ncbi:hypothetical protein IJN73_01405 [Candidatus Saccharibacteria bacterium]|nr:hypothetical protein [Candidatus Saccharibacteria bacterium]